MTLPRTIHRRQARKRAKADAIRRQAEWDALTPKEQARRTAMREMFHLPLSRNPRIIPAVPQQMQCSCGYVVSARSTRAALDAIVAHCFFTGLAPCVVAFARLMP